MQHLHVGSRESRVQLACKLAGGRLFEVVLPLLFSIRPSLSQRRRPELDWRR